MDGLSFFSRSIKGDGETLWAREWSSELVATLRQKKVTSITIDSWDDQVHGVEVWGECAGQITTLRILTLLPDFSFVSHFSNLEDLSISFTPHYGDNERDLGKRLEQLDFSQLKCLRSCRISNAKSLGNLASCPALEELALEDTLLKDLTNLTPLTSLRVLEVRGLQLESLRGIAQLTALRTLVFADVRLKSLDGVEELIQRFGSIDLKELGKLTRTGVRFDIDEIEAREKEGWAFVEGGPVRYATPISLEQPGCMLFLVDQSGSMRAQEEDPPNVSTAQAVSDAINYFLRNLSLRCVEEGKVRDYWHIGVLGYGDTTTTAFRGALTGRGLVPISEIAAYPLRYTEHGEGASDDAVPLPYWQTPFPMWIEPLSEGNTQLRRALAAAREELEQWIRQYPMSFPPIVVHFTDGRASYTDGHPGGEAWALKRLATTDGNVLFFQLVEILSMNRWVEPFEFLALRHHRDDLLRTTSILPPCMRTAAWDAGYDVTLDSRGFVINPCLEYILDALDIFTAVPGFLTARQRVRLAVHQRPPRPVPLPTKILSTAEVSLEEDATEKHSRALVFRKGSSDKFWKITLVGKTQAIQFGRRNAIGRTQTKTFASPEAAYTAYEKLIAEKLKKGYVEEISASGTATLALSREQFWGLIAKSRQGVADCDEQVERLVEFLTPLDEQQLFAFNHHYNTCFAEAYRWDLWGIAYLIQDGCSDDGFVDVIGWLIGQGQKYYEAALADPANLGKRVRPGETIECESMAYAASQAYEAKTGKNDFDERYEKQFSQEYPDLKGEPWADDDELKELYPTLARKFRR